MKLLLSKEKALKLLEKLHKHPLPIQVKDVDDDILFSVDAKNEVMFINLLQEVIDESESIWLETYEGQIHMKPSRCLYFTVLDNDVVLHTPSNEVLYLRHTLAELETLLKDHAFVRINKSTIVNLKQITFIKPVLYSKVEITLSHVVLEVSRFYLNAFKKALKEKGGV